MNSVYWLFEATGARLYGSPVYMTRKHMFNQLYLSKTEFRVGALQQLLQIYQLTSDWQKAIEVAERLVKLGKDKQRIEIAHFTVS